MFIYVSAVPVETREGVRVPDLEAVVSLHMGPWDRAWELWKSRKLTPEPSLQALEQNS